MLPKVFLLLGVMCLALADPPEIRNGKSDKRVPGEYLVVLNPPSATTDKEQYVNGAANKIKGLGQLEVEDHFIIKKFAALKIHGSEEAVVRRIFNIPEVQYIEANLEEKMIEQSCINENTGSSLWGLSRLISNSLPDFSGAQYSYTADNDGGDTHAYVLDTGIDTRHADFNGRAVLEYTIRELRREKYEDGNGHGTHCAGTIMSSTYGVAKDAKAVGVKVLSSRGSGTTTGVIEGINWVCNDFVAKKNALGTSYKAVASMSLGGSKSSSLEAAIQNCIDEGLPFVVAGGNSNADACSQSPAGLVSAISVGATDRYDQLASFSNYGTCIDILAPGVDILSTYISTRKGRKATDGTARLSGTSMAAPHVAGVLLRYMDHLGYRPTVAEITTWVTSFATQNAVGLGSRTTTPNKLLYAPCTL